MRTIGKKNIRLVKAFTLSEIGANDPLVKAGVIGTNYKNLNERVSILLSPKMFELWEGAWDEINRVINDTASDFSHRR